MRNEFDYTDGPEAEESSLDLNKILQFLRRRRWAILIATGLALVPASIRPFTMPNIYESSATVEIQDKPEVMDIGADLIGAGGRERTRVASMVTLAQSSAVLGRIVDQMPAPKKAEPVEPGFVSRALARVGIERGKRAAPSDDQERQRRVQKLQNQIEVDVEGGGTVLRIYARGTDPVFTTFLSNAAADALVAFRRDQHSEASRKALSWLNEQTYDLRTRVERRQESLDALVTESGVQPGLNGDLRRSELENEISQADLQLLVNRRRIGELRGKLDRFARVAEKNAASQATVEQYRQARAALSAARLTYKETHPQVKRLEAMVADLESKVAPIRPGGGGNLEDVAELRLLESETSRLNTRVAGLRKNLEALTSSPQADSEAQARYDRIDRERTLDQQMLEVLLKRRNETLLAAATEHPGVQVLDYAVPPSGPIGPKRLLLLVFGLAMALGFGGAIAIALELMDRSVREPEEVTAALGLPMLAMIPLAEPGEVIPERQCADLAGAPASEAYRNLRTSLLFAMNRQELSTLLVTSAVAGEGKTTVSSNLAASFAIMGRKVLLVDADMRRARVHKVFSLSRAPGLSEVLRGQTRLEDAVQRPEGAEFDVLAAGSMPDNPSELITSPKRDLVMARIRNQYDMVILDSPVLLAVSDALILSADADATVLVHKLGSVDKRALTRLKQDLKRAKANTLGVVFNHIDSGDPYIYPAYMESPYHTTDDSNKSWLRRRFARAE